MEVITSITARDLIPVVLAARQTRGKGRAGNAWSSLDGNLFATLAWPLGQVPLERRAQVSFCVALALASALRDQGVADGTISLKWPNDVLLNGAKVAGLLLEAEGQNVNVGIGVNIVAAPVVDQPVTTLAAHSEQSTIAAADLLKSFLTALEFQVDRWIEQGFEPVRAEWLSRAHRLGEDIRARFGAAADQTVLTGRFDGIDEAGRLILRTTDGVQHFISAASVHDI